MPVYQDDKTENADDQEWRHPYEGKTPSSDELDSHFNTGDAEYPEGHPSAKDADIQTLEDAFNAPSAQYPKGHPSESKESQSLNALDLYNPDSPDNKKTSAKGFFSFNMTKKKGGAIGASVGVIGMLLFGAWSLGPLQFIHFSELLQGIHFSDQEYEGNSRLKKLMIYAKTNKYEATRVGVLGNLYANKIDREFAKNGWKIQMGSAGSFKGFVYDPATGDNKITDEKSQIKHNKELKAALEKEGVKGITFEDGGKKLNLPNDGTKYWSNKRLLSTVYGGTMDVGRITAAFEKRLMLKRAGIVWNPLTKLDAKVNTTIAERVKKFREDRSARLSGKVNPTMTVGVDPAKDTTDAEKARETAEKQAANDTAETAKDAKSGKLKSGGVKLAKGAGLLGLFCMVKMVADGASTASQANRLVPLIQTGADVVGVGAKIEADRDVDEIAIGEISKSLDSKENGSFSGANSLQYEQGKEGGTKLPVEVDPRGGSNFVSEMLAGVPGLDGVCKVINSTVGMIVAGMTNIATSAAMAAFFAVPPGNQLFPKLIDLFTTDVVDLTQSKYAGPVYGEAANVGTRILANETAATMGGRVLSGAEELALKDTVEKDKAQFDATRSIADKYLNPYNYDTPVAQAIDKVQFTDPAGTLANIPTNLMSSFLKPFKGNAQAASSPDAVYYGYNKIAFASGSMDNPEFENPYKNADEAADIIDRTGDKYIKLLKTCNKVDVIKDATGKLDFTSEAGTSSAPAILTNYDKLPDECKSDNLEFLKIRVALFDTMKMKSYVCIEFDDEKSCADITGEVAGTALTTLPGFKIMTFNLNSAGFDSDHPDHKWADRKDAVKTIISKYNPDIFGAQEVWRDEMFTDLTTMLPQYGTTSSAKLAKRNPIFFNPNAFSLIKDGSFNLSGETSKDVTWAVLEHKTRAGRVFVFNSHLAHGDGSTADDTRNTQAKEIVKRIKELNTDNDPVILIGDMNTTSEAKDSPINKFFADGFINSENVATEKINAEYGSFNGYEDIHKGNNIDYILVKDPNAEITVSGYEVNIDMPNGEFASDHNAIIASLVFMGAGQTSSTGEIGIDGYAWPVDIYKNFVSNNQENVGTWSCNTTKPTCHYEGSPNAFDLTDYRTKAGKGDQFSVGKSVFAITSGKVNGVKVYDGISGCYSLHVVGDDGWDYWYGHIRNPVINPGATKQVKAGEKIAEIGERKCTGNGSYPHLHIDRGYPKGYSGGYTNHRDKALEDLIVNLHNSLTK